MVSPASIVVCLKWSLVEPSVDERFTGMSAADGAALELGLRAGEASHSDVVVVTAGPTASEKILREALACGATRAIRIDTPADAASVDNAREVARLLADFDQLGLVWCGDYSPDRGSGSFPAFLAAHLGLDQALGLIRVEFPAAGSLPLDVVRRLDGGRRERLEVRSSAVLSVEGSLGRLRRATLSGALAARSAPIEVVDSGVDHVEAPVLRPYRPRARSVQSPNGSTALDRIRAVAVSSAPASRSDPMTLEPSEAARAILGKLRDWGYIG